MTTSNSEQVALIDKLLEAARMLNPDNPMEAAEEFFAQAAEAKREREMTPFERGHRDAFEIGRTHNNLYAEGSDEHARYEAGYEEGSEARNEENLRLEDERCDQIERDYLDGECDISGNYYVTHDW